MAPNKTSCPRYLLTDRGEIRATSREREMRKSVEIDNTGTGRFAYLRHIFVQRYAIEV